MAAAKDPELIVGSGCPAGSKRTHPWMLFEDRNGDGYFDHVVTGACDGSTAERDFNVMPSDPWTLSPGDVPVGNLPSNAVASSIVLNEAHVVSSTGLFVWTATEYHEGNIVASYTRNEAGALVMSTP